MINRYAEKGFELNAFRIGGEGGAVGGKERLFPEFLVVKISWSGLNWIRIYYLESGLRDRFTVRDRVFKYVPG